MANPSPDEGVRAALKALVKATQEFHEAATSHLHDSDFELDHFLGKAEAKLSVTALPAALAALSTPVPEEGLPRQHLWRIPGRGWVLSGESEEPTTEAKIAGQWVKTEIVPLPRPNEAVGLPRGTASAADRETVRWGDSGPPPGHFGDEFAPGPSPLPSQGEPVAWIVEESLFGQWRERIVTEKSEEGPRIRILGSLYTAEALAAERARADRAVEWQARTQAQYVKANDALIQAEARADSLKAELDEARQAIQEDGETIAECVTRAEAAEARADRAEEDERDRLLEKWSKMSAQWTDTAVWWLGNNGAMLPADRAALRARTILKETPHGER